MHLELEVNKNYICLDLNVKHIRIVRRVKGLVRSWYEGEIYYYDDRPALLGLRWLPDGAFLGGPNADLDIIGEYSEPEEAKLTFGGLRKTYQELTSAPTKCTCNIHELMRNGCKCGGS